MTRLFAGLRELRSVVGDRGVPLVDVAADEIGRDLDLLDHVLLCCSVEVIRA
ncbi:MAG TPA: hypothetical protein VGO77_11900 [Mycobacterium sp.]|nr:hypothetical protein [Mycobacterium sp.]